MPSDLWRSINYKTPIKYFINTYIREYDLSKANINALLYQKRINKKEYDEFYSMDKKLREIKIGLMIKKDKSIYKDIQNGIIEAKRKLVLSNELEDFDIVSIKNDAVFVVGKQLPYTEFPPFKFNLKNEYTMYLQLQELEIYYGDIIDSISGDIVTNIDIKGMSDESVLLHQNGMLDLICDACYRLQREDIESTMKWISDIYEKYIRRELPIQYYRSFDSESMYTINTFIRKAHLPEIDSSMLYCIDINRNLSILRNLVAIISDVYRMKKNKR